jgi:hypothetical protein
MSQRAHPRHGHRPPCQVPPKNHPVHPPAPTPSQPKVEGGARRARDGHWAPGRARARCSRNHPPATQPRAVPQGEARTRLMAGHRAPRVGDWTRSPGGGVAPCARSRPVWAKGRGGLGCGGPGARTGWELPEAAPAPVRFLAGGCWGRRGFQRRGLDAGFRRQAHSPGALFRRSPPLLTTAAHHPELPASSRPGRVAANAGGVLPGRRVHAATG